MTKAVERGPNVFEDIGFDLIRSFVVGDPDLLDFADLEARVKTRSDHPLLKDIDLAPERIKELTEAFNTYRPVTAVLLGQVIVMNKYNELEGIL